MILRTLHAMMRRRKGFSLLELMIVLIIAGIVGTVAVPAFSRSLAQNRAQKAASVLAADLQLAHSMAGRRRAPVRISMDKTARRLRIRNFSGTDTVYSQRWFTSDSEYPVTGITGDTGTVVMPNGLLTTPVQFDLSAGTATRQVLMSRIGQVRVKTP